MSKHCNRFATLLTALLATNMGVAQAAVAQPTPEAAITSSRDWLDDAISLLEAIITLLGGDVTKVREEPELSGKLDVVASHYAGHGIPTNLTTQQRQQLISAIDSLYAMLNSPPSPIIRPDAFLEVLEEMWLDLGMPLVDLGSTVNH